MVSTRSVAAPRLRAPVFLLTLLVSLAVGLSTAAPRQRGAISPVPAPAFTHAGAEDWLNSDPLTLESLRGKVVLVDFWAFECWNCYRSFPWLNGLEGEFEEQGLQVIGIHAPEFERERHRAAVAAKAREFELHHPLMIDNDFSYWRALGNRYWPTYYLIDKRGRVRYRFIGETHAGSEQARQVERAVRALLAEPA
ncbi:MAG: redoxin domain-containing protein [Pseudomonadota bacterium]